MSKNIEIEITESWEHYKDTLYEYVSEKPRNLTEILNQIGGTKKDIDLAIHDLILNKKPILIDLVNNDYIIPKFNKDVSIGIIVRVNKIREFQEEINALKEMSFDNEHK